MIELGISTFGETTEIEGTGIIPSHDERIRNMIEEMKLADEVGLDLYAIGEHHREDFFYRIIPIIRLRFGRL